MIFALSKNKQKRRPAERPGGHIYPDKDPQGYSTAFSTAGRGSSILYVNATKFKIDVDALTGKVIEYGEKRVSSRGWQDCDDRFGRDD